MVFFNNQWWRKGQYARAGADGLAILAGTAKLTAASILLALVNGKADARAGMTAQLHSQSQHHVMHVLSVQHIAQVCCCQKVRQNQPVTCTVQGPSAPCVGMKQGAYQGEAVSAAALIAAEVVLAGLLALRGTLRALINVLTLEPVTPPAWRCMHTSLHPDRYQARRYTILIVCRNNIAEYDPTN